MKKKAKTPPAVLPVDPKNEVGLLPPPDMVPKKHYEALEQVLEMTKHTHATEIRLLQAENATMRRMLSERGLQLVGGNGG